MKFLQESKLNQKSHWDNVFAERAAFFGDEPSSFARNSLDLFRKEGVRSILELGCGQGRDTFFFSQYDLEVTALDFSETAISSIREKAQAANIASKLHAQAHNLKGALPFPDNSFDACFSHMLLCMEFSTMEIGFILKETHRILKPGGLAVYSVRNNFDKHYRAGTHLIEDIYEIGGFVIHFFTEERTKVTRLCICIKKWQTDLTVAVKKNCRFHLKSINQWFKNGGSRTIPDCHILLG